MKARGGERRRQPSPAEAAGGGCGERCSRELRRRVRATCQVIWLKMSGQWMEEE